MVVVRYEPDGKQQSDILQLLITNQKPIVKQTLDLGDRIVEKNVATTTKPKDVTTPEQIFGLEGSHE